MGLFPILYQTVSDLLNDLFVSVMLLCVIRLFLGGHKTRNKINGKSQDEVDTFFDFFLSHQIKNISSNKSTNLKIVGV